MAAKFEHRSNREKCEAQREERKSNKNRTTNHRKVFTLYIEGRVAINQAEKMDYATHFHDVMTSADFLAFKRHWVETFARPEINRDHGKRTGALVVGAGVTGLTTAIRLALDGFNVKVIANEFAPKDTMAPGYVSTVAGALWEYPPAVCGRHKNEVSIARSKTWAVTTYDFLNDLAKLPGDHGVGMKNTIFYTRFKIEDRPEELEKMNAYAKYCHGFQRGLHLVNPDVISAAEVKEIKDCYQVMCPIIDTNKYTLWQHLLALSLGVKIYEGELPAPLHKYEAQIHKQFGVSLIVNCSGLGSLKLVPDPGVYPLRGALVRVWNDGRDFPVVNTAHAIGHDHFNVDKDGKSIQDIIFLVPRGNVLLLGGIAEEDQWNTDVTLDNYRPFQEMLDRCRKFMPVLEKATIVKEEPVRVGLRPGHTTGVKNYVQKNTNIIHSYGHGGSGFSFSIGCANEVVMRAHKLRRQDKQVSLKSHL